MLISRRELGLLALAAVPGARLLAAAKPDSKVAGVQIGLNVPYNFGARMMDGDEVLKRCVDLNISAVELRSQPVEAFAGTPLSMDKVKAFRRKWDDAGVKIEIVKFDDVYKMSDDDWDRDLDESGPEDDPRRNSPYRRVSRARDMVGFHGHGKTKPEHWETAFGFSKYNGANVDLGHFFTGNNLSPIPFITKYHDRVTHVHVKDRKKEMGPNVPFGEGDTPIKEALQLIRDKKWNMQATIEFEYPVPPGSDRMAEMAKCIQYCRSALNA
jgi:hypothetical protein